MPREVTYSPTRPVVPTTSWEPYARLTVFAAPSERSRCTGVLTSGGVTCDSELGNFIRRRLCERRPIDHRLIELLSMSFRLARLRVRPRAVTSLRYGSPRGTFPSVVLTFATASHCGSRTLSVIRWVAASSFAGDDPRAPCTYRCRTSRNASISAHVELTPCVP